MAMCYLRRILLNFNDRIINMIGLNSMRSFSSSGEVFPGVDTANKTSLPHGHIVLVEGNIGVGKTTLTCQLGRKLDYRIFLEPTSRNPYLAKFYEEPNKYALKMQLWLFRQRCMMYMRAVKHWMKSGHGVILDRSLFSDHVFASVSHSDGYISNEGYQRYCHLRKQVLTLVPFPDIVVYLNAVPDECQKRIASRGRECESKIPINYLSSLDSSYTRLLEEMRCQGCKVLLYDWSEFGFSAEVDKDIRNFACRRSNLDNENYELIYKNIQNIFDTDTDLSDAGLLSEDEVDDDELLEQEKESHYQETRGQPSPKS